MAIGSGCKVHLKADELPKGTIIANVSGHFVCVIDGVIQDTYDCSRGGTRCVYGYYYFVEQDVQPVIEEALTPQISSTMPYSIDKDKEDVQQLINQIHSVIQRVEEIDPVASSQLYSITYDMFQELVVYCNGRMSHKFNVEELEKLGYLPKH
jgi:hypothetical protein